MTRIMKMQRKINRSQTASDNKVPMLSLLKKYIAFMQIDEKVFHNLISKRKTIVHISSVLNARRFAPHVYLPRIVVPNIKNKRNSHFIGLQTDLSRSV